MPQFLFIFIEMKTASIQEIKQELQNLSIKEITDLCLRLARYKKENKELLSYILFDAQDIETYIKEAKESIDDAFKEMNITNLYLAKKSIRKILRQANKYIKYSQNKQAEVELLLHFGIRIKTSGIPFHKNKALNNLYNQQIKKLKAALSTLHEDIQYDFLKQVEAL